MTWLEISIATALVNITLAELLDWAPWLARRIVERAVRRLPPSSQTRYREEWLAELEVLPGRRASPVIFALRLLVRARHVTYELTGEIRSAGPEIAVKHAFDRVLTLVMLILFSPVIAATALAVRLSSPGPVLFKQRRVGRDGKEFDFYKFRSMRISTGQKQCREPSGLHFPLGGDIAPGDVECVDRRTGVGRFLRSSSLDELPQLFSVIKGDMSLVGPRPERPEFVELFRQDIQRYGDRHRVKPGITGLAQVHGLRGQTSLTERVDWDNYYIAHRSLRLDLKILLLTILVLFRDVS